MYLTTLQQILTLKLKLHLFIYLLKSEMFHLSLIDFQPRMASDTYYFCLLRFCHIIDNTCYIRGTHIWKNYFVKEDFYNITA